MVRGKRISQFKGNTISIGTRLGNILVIDFLTGKLVEQYNNHKTRAGKITF